MCSIPAPDRASTRLGAPRPNWPPGELAGVGRGGADDVTSANVTAPLPGSPTAPFAGPLRPKPPPGPGAPAVIGAAATVGRATLAVIPPGQGRDAASGVAAEVNCFSHSIRPRSVSITKILSELPPTNPNIRNPRYPINRSSVAGGVSESSCLGSFLSFIFHRSWKPRLCMVSTEIFASVLTQDERCASPLPVIQSAPPRP